MSDSKIHTTKMLLAVKFDEKKTENFHYKITINNFGERFFFSFFLSRHIQKNKNDLRLR